MGSHRGLSVDMEGLLLEDKAKAKCFDAIIIPGGGLEPDTSLPQPWVRARLDAALKLSSRTKYFVALSRGTTHRPPSLDARGFPITESAASAKYLLDHGVEDPARILLDGWSLDTIGNAFFARNMICEPMQLKRCCVITSAFHMPRTRAIFEWVFSLESEKFDIDYCVTPDVGLDDAMASARVEKEKNSLITLQEKKIPRIKTLGELSLFLFVEHAAYNSRAVMSSTQVADLNRSDSNKDGSAVRSTY